MSVRAPSSEARMRLRLLSLSSLIEGSAESTCCAEDVNCRSPRICAARGFMIGAGAAGCCCGGRYAGAAW